MKVLKSFCIITCSIFIPSRKIIINRKLNILLILYHSWGNNIMKHKGFDKNWNNVLRHWCWYLKMDMFVTISTINPHTSHFSIFKLKLNHEQRKHLWHWFKDMITSMGYDIVGFINQNIQENEPYSLMDNHNIPMILTIVLVY